MPIDLWTKERHIFFIMIKNAAVIRVKVFLSILIQSITSYILAFHKYIDLILMHSLKVYM